MNYKKLGVGAVLVGMLLSGCSQTSSPQPFNILEDAEPIPLVFTEGFSVGALVSEGLAAQSVATLDTYTVVVNDLNGYPFLNLTITAPRVIGDDIYAFAKTLSGQEWKGQAGDSPWTITITGATNVRDVLVVRNVGLDLLRDMVKTIDALGGPTKLQELVAVEPDYYVLKDVKGGLWEIGATKSLSSSAKQNLIDHYNEIYQANNTPEFKKTMQDLWAKAMSQASDSAGGNLQSLANPDGSLNMDLAVQQLGQLETQTKDKDEASCFLFFCVTINHGHIEPSRQATQGGFYQKKFYYGIPYTGDQSGFPTISCIINDKQYNKELGCGPSAFIGLITRKFLDFSNGKPLYSFAGKNFLNTSVLGFQQWLVAQVGVNGRPRIANYMGTCWNGGGSMTVGAGFTSGGNNFLKDAGSSLRVHSNVSHLAGNLIAAPAKADMLKSQIGTANNPVVAEYFRGPFQGHFSPVTEYNIYNGFTTIVNVKTKDDPNNFYSLSIGWGAERGVFYLQ